MRFRFKNITFLSAVLMLGSVLFGETLRAAQGQFTLLHTNDLHSHFRPDHSPLAFGGVGRIKTLVDRIRASTPNVLFVDGGDWSEGSVYYTEGAGRESLRLMDQLGYDVAVVGNHDWINGPDFLLKAIREANPSMSIIGANMDSRSYVRSRELQDRVPPYVIKEVGNVRVAFIGLLAYNFVFDGYFAPVRLSDPFTSASQLARELKKNVDVVIGISHNIVDTNLKILKAVPEMDGIIGAHDHRQLNEPLWVERSGAAPGWLVETGYHGRYVGKVDLSVTSQKHVRLEGYRLIQVDRSIPEDPSVVEEITEIERLIERHRGISFHDYLGDSEVETSRDGLECSLGAFTTHAFRSAVSSVDGAMDHPNFIYSPLHEGPVRSADAFDIHPAIFQPQTGKTWNLQILSLRGKTLSWLLHLGGAFPGILSAGRFMSVSGIQATWDASSSSFISLFSNNFKGKDFANFGFPLSRSSFKDILINGLPVELERVYRFSVSYGVIESIRFINSIIPGIISVEDVQDTGIEAWRAIAAYIQKTRVITLDSLRLGSRIRTQGIDLGLHYNDVRWKNVHRFGSEVVADVYVTVHNSGLSPSRSDSVKVSLFNNIHGADLGVNPEYELLSSKKLPPLDPGGEHTLVFLGIRLKEDRGVYPVTVQVIHDSTNSGPEANGMNNEVIHWFRKGEG